MIQQEYIERYTLSVTHAIKLRLGIYEMLDRNSAFIDKYLIRAFDMGIMEPGDSECPGLQELKELLVPLGKLVDRDDKVEITLKGLDKLKLCREDK